MTSYTPLAIVVAVVGGTLLFAFFSVRRMTMSPQEYMVGGRGFGTVFLWVLLAGEIYTSFTFLGAAGYAYNFGAPAFYIMAYGTVGYIFWYFFLPWVWRMGKEHGLLTAPDFFTARYNNRVLTTLVSVIYCLAIVPYVTLQLSAVQIFLTIAGYGAIDAQLGAIISFLIITGFVFATGLRGTAWASIVKDAIVIAALIFAGIAIPIQFFGSPAGMFDQLVRAHPSYLTLGNWTAPKGAIWFVSTVILTGLGYFTGPHSLAAVYSAKDESVIRRNSIFLPLYQLIVVLVLFAGFSALLIISPTLHGPAADQSFLLVVQKFYPPWVLGFIAAGGVLCALVPSTALLLSAASIVAKNIGGDLFGIALDDRSRVLATRTMVAVIGLCALGLWVEYKTQLVELLLLYYNGVSQFVPAFFFGYLWKRTSSWGIFAGIVVGIGVSMTLAIAQVSPFGLNSGFVGLACNVAVMAAVSLYVNRLAPIAASNISSKR